MFKKNKIKLYKRNTMFRLRIKKAFTVVEMLVVVGIFVLIASVILFNSRSFSNSANLQNVVQDTAMSIRKVQGYALGFQNFQTQYSADQLQGFGIYFGDFNTTGSPWQKKYALFADVDFGTWGIYDSVPGVCGAGALLLNSECLEEITFLSSEKITNICVSSNGTSNLIGVPVFNGSMDCLVSGDAITIYFTRPRPDAQFCRIRQLASNVCESTVFGVPISDVSIEITAANNMKKIITIWNTGQIAIK